MATADEASPIALKHIIEALLLSAGAPLSVNQMVSLFEQHEKYTGTDISKALEELAADMEGRGIELCEVASGFRLQTRASMIPWVSRLWEERPQRYSRALLETLALIAYRQPITRGEIEEVRGVSVRSNIIRTLQEREWVRVVGYRDVPGKPALFGTTKAFLDYFNLSTLDELPTLAEIRDMESLEPEFDFEPAEAEAGVTGGEEAGEVDNADTEAGSVTEADSRAHQAESLEARD